MPESSDLSLMTDRVWKGWFYMLCHGSELIGSGITGPTRSSPRSASCRPGPGTAGGVPTTASWRSANPCATGRRRAVAVSHRGVCRQGALQAVRHRHQPHAARRPSNLVAARTLRQERGGGHEDRSGRMPSGLFGANAAWLMILAHNLNAVMKRLVLAWGA